MPKIIIPILRDKKFFSEIQKLLSLSFVKDLKPEVTKEEIIINGNKKQLEPIFKELNKRNINHAPI